MEPRQLYLNLLEELRGTAELERDPQRLVDRAAGLLAGRVGCPVREAQSHLLRLADEQGRDPAEVAAEILAVLDAPASTGGAHTVRSAVDDVLRPPAGLDPGRVDGGDLPLGLGTVQDVLNSLPGPYSWVVPVRDETGAVVDFVVQAVSPAAFDVNGRQGNDLVGLSVAEIYPAIKDGPIWDINLRVLADGQPREISPYRWAGDSDGTPAESVYSVRIHRLGSGLLVGWVRHDEDSRQVERMAQTERLGNLGWAEWDLANEQVIWSDGMYRIYERDRSEGPLSNEEAATLVLPDDRPLMIQAGENFAAGLTADLTYRIRVGSRVKHVRLVADAVRDSAGRPLKVYGIVQDVTARENARLRLAEVERQLHEHQRTLAAEHRMAAQLQQIILPIPEAPVDIRGLRVAVRYLPAERASRVGGDWFHAAEVSDGGVLLAVGDVAGHGIQAATTMAQLRHALSALAVTTTTDPAALLGHLNHLLCAGRAAVDTATAVIAYYDPHDRTLTWAQAGHPAPLRTRAGVTVELPRPRGPLLGVLADAEYERASVAFEPDDLLLLYTDGLVENRDQGVSDGLAPVIEALNRITAEGSTQPLADLIAQLRRANPDDDTCILAARPLPAVPAAAPEWAGETAVPAPPDPAGVELLRRDFDIENLVPVRHEIARRSAAAGLDDTRLYWFVVAVNEITTNAVRHGGGSGQVSLWADGGRLHCRVVDRGPGIPPERQRADVRPAPDSIGGRGLWLAQQGCESMAVDSSPAGTRVTLTTLIHAPAVSPA
jgi:serine phosphatase RsbU (regulator of sigma subunit)/anti-sigma regulatory factor (Ser/Thr protein kinase)